MTEQKEPVTILFRRGRYNRRTGRHNADQVIIVQKVKPKDIYIAPFTRKNPKGHGPRVPVKGHKRVLNKKKKSSTIIDLDERERKRRRRKLYNQRRKNRSPTKKTTKRR